MMQALQVLRVGDDFEGVQVVEVAAPRAGPGQVLIKVRAASLNFPDLLMPKGKYQHKPETPFTLGGDLAGEVVAVGEGVSRIQAGEQVSGVGLGAFAEYAVLPEATIDPKPSALDFAETAAFGAAYLTAHVALCERGRLRPNEWVLVHGSTGGMGLAAVDLAKALGARVIATSTSDAKLAEVAALYAPDAVINARNGFREEVKALTGGRGADIIFDPVNGDVFDESMRCIAFDGRLLVIGFTGGRIASVNTNLPMIKACSIVGVRAGEYGRRFPEARRAISAELLRLAEERRIRPHIAARFRLEQWRDAFALMESRQAVGKIVFEIG
jgi:NADPH2:quinone reductase